MCLVSNVNMLFHSLHKICTVVTCQLGDPLLVSQSSHHVPRAEFSGALPAMQIPLKIHFCFISVQF